MDTEALKAAAAKAALAYVDEDEIVGVGTGSTVNYFIEELANIAPRLQGAVASSEATRELLKSHHIPVYELNAVDRVPVYIDGADEANHLHQLIKGGGRGVNA